MVLAAGASRRFRAVAGTEATKLLASYRGQPMVRRVVEAALASRAAPVIVVTGYFAEEVGRALADLPVLLRHNPDFAAGLSTSLRAGIAAVPPDCEAALILLADMPSVGPGLMDDLIGAWEAGGADAIVPVCEGQRGNPVILSRRLFAELHGLSGDKGAGLLLRRGDLKVREWPADARVLADVDTPDALE